MTYRMIMMGLDSLGCGRVPEGFKNCSAIQLAVFFCFIDDRTDDRGTGYNPLVASVASLSRH